MAQYTCGVCGYTYDEAAGVLFSELSDSWLCPVCSAGKQQFTLTSSPAKETGYTGTSVMDEIHYMAETGRSITEPMETLMPVPSFDEMLLLGAQLSRLPLDDDAPVNVRTVIGKHAKQPMVLETPVFVSHMSFGALSREAKIALAKGSAAAKTAMCSGEGGILPEEKEASYRYIFEYVPNRYSVTDKNLSEADAIEIKIGQGTKPGMGGHLPGAKVTEEIAHIREKPVGEDVLSPSHFPGITTPEDL
ncbi:MAG TPA: glutamate synthase-related protein, partial [Methanocorpusculum sp.]|nr:glutamate synthase-related protein [Methanocorpusculum sp.]